MWGTQTFSLQGSCSANRLGVAPPWARPVRGARDMKTETQDLLKNTASHKATRRVLA